MEGAASFTDVPGWGTAVVGATALGATFLARLQPTAGRWLLVWLLEAVLAASIASAFIWRKARRRIAAEGGSTERPVFGIGARKFLLGFWPGIFAGALLTFALIDFSTVWTTGGEVPRLLPGMWLVLYGVAILTAGAWSVRAVPTMGLGFLVLGAVTLYLPASAGDAMLALGFGLWHITMGLIIARRHGG